MNASCSAISRARKPEGSRPLTGFVNFLAKEAQEWLRTRRFLAMTLIATALALSGALIEAFRQLAGDTTTSVNLDPSYNLHMVGWDSLVPLFAGFGTMSLIVAERGRGTLAWSLSAPLSRPAVLLAKLLAAVFFVGISVVVIPELVSIGVIRIVYGGVPPHALELFWEPLGGFALAVFVIALNFAVSMFVKGQIAVIGTTLVTCLTVTPIVGTVSRDFQRYLPTEIYTYVTDAATGAAFHPETLVAWAVSVVVLLAVAIVCFNRSEV